MKLALVSTVRPVVSSSPVLRMTARSMVMDATLQQGRGGDHTPLRPGGHQLHVAGTPPPFTRRTAFA